jgi:hypothetical protein
MADLDWLFTIILALGFIALLTFVDISGGDDD